jgi:hypothetical protein
MFLKTVILSEQYIHYIYYIEKYVVYYSTYVAV